MGMDNSQTRFEIINMQTPTKRGGKRPGAGAKSKCLNRVKVNFMLLPEVANYLKSQYKKPSEIIEEIILNNCLNNSLAPNRR